jgi:hypothetical protein
MPGELAEKRHSVRRKFCNGREIALARPTGVHRYAWAGVVDVNIVIGRPGRAGLTVPNLSYVHNFEVALGNRHNAPWQLSLR